MPEPIPARPRTEQERLDYLKRSVDVADALTILLVGETRKPGPRHRLVVGCRCYSCGWNAALDRAMDLLRQWKT